MAYLAGAEMTRLVRTKNTVEQATLREQMGFATLLGAMGALF